MTVEAVVIKAGGFGYGGQQVFNGEIIEMRGLPNDGRLINLGYMVRYDSSDHDRKSEVESSGRRFIDDPYRLDFLRQAEEVEAERHRTRRLPDQAEVEYNAVVGAGLRPVGDVKGPSQASMAGVAVPEAPVAAAEDDKPACPICSRGISKKNMRRHVATHDKEGADAE